MDYVASEGAVGEVVDRADDGDRGARARCAAAIENILIAAHAKGLGAVWLGVHPSEALIKGTKELLGVPDHVTPLGIVSLGVPAEEKAPRDNYNLERVHWN